jgi:hypothetical protein
MNELTPVEWMRQSRRILVQCYFQHGCDQGAALVAYRAQVRKGFVHEYSRLDKELDYAMAMWVYESSVQQRPYTSHGPAVSDEVIKEFAFKLASGHSIPIYTFVDDQPVRPAVARPVTSSSS